MLRTLNFTDRKRILREEAQISLMREADGGMIFDVELDLSRLDLPTDAQVFIEAFFKTTTERFSWGTVGELIPPDHRQLKRLSQPGLAHFRVKVVEATGNGFGKLLALADHIAPEGMQGGEGRRISLFRVNPTNALTDEVWSLDFDDSGPILDLNRGVPGIKERVKEEAFMALVFPAVMRGIFEKVRSDGCNVSQDDRDGWQARWLRYGAKLAGCECPPRSDDDPDENYNEWVKELIGGWSRQHKIVSNFKRSVAGKEGDAK